jgi:hypothetical protein
VHEVWPVCGETAGDSIAKGVSQDVDRGVRQCCQHASNICGEVMKRTPF